jgi:hypothetical protein
MSSSEVYEGDFVENEFHGKGKLSFGDGSFYEGDFICGNYHGKGKMTYPDGRVEEGNWENNKFTGNIDALTYSL